MHGILSKKYFEPTIKEMRELVEASFRVGGVGEASKKIKIYYSN